MPSFSGADIILQLREGLLNTILRQNFDAEQAALEAEAGEEPFWNLQKADPVFRMRFQQSPSIHLRASGPAVITLPENTFEAEKTFTIKGHSVTIVAQGTCSIEVECHLELAPSAAAGKVDVVIRQGAIAVVLTSLTLGDEEVTDAQRAVMQTLLSNRLAETGGEMLEGKVVAQLDLSKQGLDPSCFRVQTGFERLALYAKVSGAPPAEILLFDDAEDLIVAIGASIVQPKFQAEIDAKTVNAPPRKMNGHYDMKVNWMSVALVDAGLNITGSAIAIGHGNHWYEPDWLYPDIDATINSIVLSFKEIRKPDGYFVFEKTHEDVDVDDCDVFRLFLAGLFTFGMGWGASPAWIFFPVGGWIAGIVELVSMGGQGLSSISVKPELPTDVKGVSVQFERASFGAEGIVLYGRQGSDLAQNQSALTSSCGALRLVGEIKPNYASETVDVSLDTPWMWRGNRRYEVRWRVDGRTVKEGPLAEHPHLEVGPVTVAQAQAHGHQLTVNLDLFEKDDRGQLRYVKTFERRLAAVGPFGELRSCYLMNNRGKRLHLSLPGRHCYQVALAFPGNLKWGLPVPAVQEDWRTCPDCFGRGAPIAEVRAPLTALENAWKVDPDAARSWRI